MKILSAENKQYIYIAFGCALLLVMLSAYLILRSHRQTKENAQWIIHTHQVISESERLFSLVKDAQRGQRGYLLVGDEQYLEPYHTSRKATKDILEKLRKHTDDEPVQQERLKNISGLISRSFAFWDSTLTMYNLGNAAQAFAIIRSGRGNRLVMAIDARIDTFQSFEQQLLKERQKRYYASQKEATMISIGSGLTSLLLLFFAFGLMQNHLFRKEKLRQMLEEKVEERTSALQLSMDQLQNYTRRLSENEERLRTMADAVPVKLYMTDHQGNVRYFNPHFLAFLGKSSAEVSSVHWTENIHPDDVGNFLHLYQQSLATEKSFETQFRLLHHSGKYHFVINRAVPMLREGQFDGYIGSIQDVTNLIESQQALSQTIHELENYQQALDKSALISITDKTGTIMHVNDLFCQVAKYSREELIGQNHRIIKSSVHPKEFFREMWATIARGQLWRGEICNKAKDGSLYWVDTIINPIYNRKGIIEQYLSIRYEITSRKKAEETLRKQNEELLKTNEELDAFVYRAGHDLRAPLVSVLGLINIAQMDPSPATKDHYMNLMSSSIHKLDSFIRDIIDFSRNARTGISLEQVRLGPLLQEIRNNLTYMPNHPVELIIELEEKAHFMSDAKRLSVVLSNLLSNAYRYANPTQAHSFVRLKAVVTETQATFTIEDNGIGIGQEHLEKVFQMFYRATQTKNGSGLGLYIVKETVETLGGSIEVSSTLGAGTTFTITLPNRKEAVTGAAR